MTELRTTSTDTWTPTQAFALAAVSLLLGVCGGWIVRRATASSVPAAQQAVVAPSPVEPPSPLPPFSLGGPLAAGPSAEDLKKASDSEAAPLLEQLKSAPTNPALLARVGNIYYDAKLYSQAIDYYERSLKFQPADTSVRTDLGTAYWYSGNADTAITEFNKALSYDPAKADTLFNLGIVKWQGKMDAKGAVAAWQKLLEANPGYAEKDKVQQLIAQAQGNS
jgi:cytochrome c-type biogenesis protein CcmH/NrfG